MSTLYSSVGLHVLWSKIYKLVAFQKRAHTSARQILLLKIEKIQEYLTQTVATLLFVGNRDMHVLSTWSVTQK